MSDESPLTGMEIAVVGMACRFPGARGVEEFWANLRDGVESITFLSRQEMEEAGESPELIDTPNYVPVARLIEGEDLFDAQLFGSSPREAEIMDPQHRLLLECAWEALETAGYDSERFPGLIGVYAGAKMNSYIWNLYSNPRIIQAVGDFQAQISNEKDYVATRVAYKLSLGGPAVTVQSACSTSLVAIHLACQGLLAGECDMALAGGIAIRVPQRSGHVYREGEILSPDGHCRAFDAQAQGTIFGNGMGLVVLRRLEDALADGDRVRAVIKGSAINNDGSVKVGYTAPGVDGQARVVRAAHLAAQVEPDSISCLEAHGTGTMLGDPIEVRALTQAFRAGTDRRGFCALGSVKTNIGHLGAAAGVAGFIKAVLALENEAIPPSLLFERPNPQIDFESSPFFVNTGLREWRRNGAPRRAGVSAFGIGGTNAHVVVEEPPLPLPPPPAPAREWQLLVMSAKTPTALEAVTTRLREHLKRDAGEPLADIAYTLQMGRRPLEQRRALVCRGRDEAVEILSAGDASRLPAGVPEGPNPPVVFLFSGQGAQYAGMGRDLYRDEPVFRDEIDRCAALIQPRLGLDLRDLLYPAPGDEEEANRRLGRTAVTQPALFTVEWALARLWMSWGIRPEAMIGHSIGEYVAACVAGVFSLEDALALVAERGRLMEGLPAGAMLSVPLPEAEVEALLGRQLSLAAVNAPGRCVVSGPEEAVAALEKQLAARGVACRRLHTSHAFHSGMMEPILAPFVERVAAVALHPPQIPYISNVTGGWIREAEATDPEYWARHLRGTVRFGAGLAELFQERTRVMLEVGPGQNLATFCRQHPGRGASRVIVSSLRHPREEQHDTAFLLRSLGTLWLAGVAPDWNTFHGGEERRRVTLPTYPFERKRYWITPGSAAGMGWSEPTAPRRKSDVADFFHVPYWRPSPPAPWPGAEGPVSWLVLADACGLADALVARLRAEGRRADVVRPGTAFARLGDGAWEIDPRHREDYTTLVAALRAEGVSADAVAHLWGVTAEDGPGASYEETQALGFYSLLWLSQALAGESGAVRIGVATTGVQRVRGTESLTPEKATVLGPCKVVPQESPRLSTVAVDVVLPPAGASLSGLAGLAESLLAEIAAPAGERSQRTLALRDGIRWVQEWDAVRLDRAAEERLPLREQGVYLITGGLGGLGLVFADYLARSWRARLVLIGRSPLPPREEWEALAATLPVDDAIGVRLRGLLALEAAGGEVMVASADVADEEALRAVAAEAVARFGAIHGVIHAAGVAGGGVAQLKTAEVAERVLAPKVLGTRALAAALAGRPLDFSLLCSSTIGILGGFGQVDYCGANCFLDAWAHAAAGWGEKVLSVNWGAWDEVGMAVQTPLPRGARAARPPAAHASVPAGPALHPLLDECLSLADDRAAFLTRFDARRHWVLAEHRIAGTGAVPGTGYLEMARAAFQHATGEATAEVRDVVFLSPVMVEDGEQREVRTSIERDGDAWGFRVESRGDGDSWQEHARGRVAALRNGAAPASPIAEIQARCKARDEEIAPNAMAEVEKLVYWGPRWQSLRRVQVGDGEGLALLELPAEFATDLEDGLLLHPALLDVATALGGALAGGTESYLPLSYRRLRARRAIPGRVWSHVRTRDGGPGRETLTVDVTLLDDAGEPVVEIEQFSMKRVGEAAGRLQRPAGKPATANPIGAGGIRPAEGVEALRRLLSCPLGPQVAVSAKDLQAMLAQAAASPAAGAGLTESPALAPQEPMTRYPRPDLKVPYAPPGSGPESLLVDIWQRVLGLEQVGIHDNFFELGGDSVMGIHVATRAAEAGLQVTPEQLFQYQTVAELAAAVGESAGPSAAPAEPVLEETETGERFPLARLEREALERILAGCEVEDLYPLSPLQQGLLFHSLTSPESGLYLEQMSCTLTGTLDVELLEAAWQQAMGRHPVLRTSFLWEDLERPLQAVSPRVALPLTVEDWRNLPEEEQRQRFEVARQADRERPFRLSEAPLMRLHLFRMADNVHRLLWTHHHLLMDGWSSPLLAQEVMASYELLRQGGELPPAPSRRYRHYIEWLEGQGLGRAEAFWRQALAGFNRPTSVRADRLGDGSPGLVTDFERLDFTVPTETAAGVQAVARQGQFTLNNVAQGLWALLLGRAAGEADVVFGITVSSRPSAIPGIETMVGLFINALPVRVRIVPEERLADWLKGLQELQGALLEHAHTPLVDVQRWSEISGDLPLFESLYEFWNFPLPAAREEERSLRMSDPRYDVATNYPLSLRVIPGERLELQITYDRRRFEASTIERLRRGLEVAMRAVATLGERPEARVGDLVAAVDEAAREELKNQAAEVSSLAQEKLRQRARRRGTPTGAGV